MFKFRPSLESLERRETPSPIGGEPVNPTDPGVPSQTGDPTNPPADHSQPVVPIG